MNHESIYQWLYKTLQKKQRLHKFLLQIHGTRGRRKRATRRPIKDRVSIHARSEVANDGRQAVHWEADLMAFFEEFSEHTGGP